MKRISWMFFCVTFLAAAQARQSPPREWPTFQVDPSWPAIPNGWVFGWVSSVSVDTQDHVWVLQRPGTLSPEEKAKAAPPVLEFDASGRFIQGWGGAGTGYEWPGTEHGIYVDPKGYVWIGGSGDNDHQLLKFTKSGKFVMQIGRAEHAAADKNSVSGDATSLAQARRDRAESLRAPRRVALR